MQEVEDIQFDVAQLQRKIAADSEVERRRQRAEELAQKRRDEAEALRKLEEEKRRKRDEDLKRKEEERKAAEAAREAERKRIQEQPLNVPKYGLQQTFASVGAAPTLSMSSSEEGRMWQVSRATCACVYVRAYLHCVDISRRQTLNASLQRRRM